jgi:hypothetical protein
MKTQTKQTPEHDQFINEMQTFFGEFYQELIKLPMEKRKEKTNQFFNEMNAHFKDNARIREPLAHIRTVFTKAVTKG